MDDGNSGTHFRILIQSFSADEFSIRSLRFGRADASRAFPGWSKLPADEGSSSSTASVGGGLKKGMLALFATGKCLLNRKFLFRLTRGASFWLRTAQWTALGPFHKVAPSENVAEMSSRLTLQCTPEYTSTCVFGNCWTTKATRLSSTAIRTQPDAVQSGIEKGPKREFRPWPAPCRIPIEGIRPNAIFGSATNGSSR